MRHPNYTNPYHKDRCKDSGKSAVPGCTVNFKTTTVSYKVHKKYVRPENEWQIIPNTQEAIISEEQWLRVQEIRENRIRPTATGRVGMFSGLVYCYDCGAKLDFCASKNLKPNQEFYRCSKYKSNRGECQIHYIREETLQKIVLKAVQGLAAFVQDYEPVFLYLMEKKSIYSRKQEQVSLENAVRNAHNRITEIDRIIARLYEDNIAGKITDERYIKLADGYEAEQKNLSRQVVSDEERLSKMKQTTIDLRLLLKTLRECTDIQELNREIVNRLIRRIEIHNNDKSSGHCHVQVDIYFTGAGMIDIPTEQEMAALMDEIQNAKGTEISA